MKSFRQFIAESKIISEGKHWPEDYVKTAKNIIKASALGQQSWYNDQYIDADLKTFVNEFSPLSHKNSNLGFFSSIVKWFVEYSASDKNKYQEFIEGKLDNIIRTLQQILNDKSYDFQRESIKKMSFKDFEKMMSDILAKGQADSDSKLANIQKKNDYELIPIYSYDELHDKFGGNETGYRGESEWCHANGKRTYDSNAWTNNGKNMFFVLAKKGWENIKPNKTDNAYDDYGTSLIAILVDVQTNALKAETLRWNHVIEPSNTKLGASIDHAFKDNWGELSQLVGFNVKEECRKYCEGLKEKLDKITAKADSEVEKILKTVDVIDKNTIPNELRKLVTNIIIPDNITHIGIQAFGWCKSLKEIVIPNSVINISNYAFYGCESLTSITIPDSVTSIGDEAFYLCKSLTTITIPDSVTTIGNGTFYGCESLTSITIPNTIISIGNSAFSICKSLTSITIPNSVTSIGEWAFNSCKSLTSITIPDSVTSIKRDLFAYCTSLTSINIPNSVINIDHGAFYECESLASITIPNSVTHIGDGVFSKCKSLTSITLPNSVTSIGEWAFNSCKSLTSITIPNSVTSIDKYAFADCKSLTSITIPDSVKNIGKYAFQDCYSLTSITIPNSVTSIGNWAFDECESLNQVIFSSNSPLINMIKHNRYKTWNINKKQIFIKKEN